MERMKEYRAVVPYSDEKDKKKLEDYIEKKTGRHVDLGPIRYQGKLTLQTLSYDLNKIGDTQITYAHWIPGPHFRSVDEFIEWHRNADDLGYFKALEEAKGTNCLIVLRYDKEADKISYGCYMRNDKAEMEKFFKVIETKAGGYRYCLLISRINGNMIMFRMYEEHYMSIGWGPESIDHFRSLIREQDKYMSEEDMMSNEKSL